MSRRQPFSMINTCDTDKGAAQTSLMPFMLYNHNCNGVQYFDVRFYKLLLLGLHGCLHTLDLIIRLLILLELMCRLLTPIRNEDAPNCIVITFFNTPNNYNNKISIKRLHRFVYYIGIKKIIQ